MMSSLSTEPWAAFVMGLFGGLHCLGMCGPLALALPDGRANPLGFVGGRLTYNMGRVATYAFLGALFGLLGNVFAIAGFQRWLSVGAGLTILAGLVLAPRMNMAFLFYRPLAFLKATLFGRLGRGMPISLLIVGLLNGLLPCGLVYVACAAAATTGEASKGAFYMFCFGLGTLPLMGVASLSGRMIHGGFRMRAGRILPWVAGTAAVLLILRGMSLGIPYLSPELPNHPSSAPVCCHDR